MALPETVELLGKRHPVIAPSFAVREELASVYCTLAGEENWLALRRACAAILGLCSTLGQAAKANYARSKYDVLAYGGDVYSYLREQGATVEEISEAGAAIITPLLEELFPREEEVSDAVGFTGPVEVA